LVLARAVSGAISKSVVRSSGHSEVTVPVNGELAELDTAVVRRAGKSLADSMVKVSSVVHANANIALASGTVNPSSVQLQQRHRKYDDEASPLFAKKTIDILSTPMSQVPKFAGKGSSSVKQKRPYADDMPIIKHSTSAAALAEGGMQELVVPGRMHSSSIYVVDVMALPRENSLVVFGLGWKVTDAPTESNLFSHQKLMEEEFTKLPMALLDTGREHTLKCGLVEDEGLMDSKSRGADQILLCRVLGVDLAEELRRASQTSSPVLRVQLGREVVLISTRTLSAGKLGHWVSRSYGGGDAAAGSGANLSASVVLTLHSDTPPYLAETMRYLELSGMRHVYLGLFSQTSPGDVRKQVQSFISRGFVSILETDEWPGGRRLGNLSRLGWAPTTLPGKLLSKVAVGWKTLINDWALYHAKNWDDLLLVHDYDELMVPTLGNTVPSVVEKLLQNRGVALQDLCFFLVCPVITYGEKGTPIEQRVGRSRAEDFPFMDGGVDTNSHIHRHRRGHDAIADRRGHDARNFSALAPRRELLEVDDEVRHDWDFCSKGGYINFFPKAIAVVETSYRTMVHSPGACTALHQDTSTGDVVGLHMGVSRDEGLIVQHMASLRVPSRWVPEDRAKKPSTFTEVWGHRLRQSN
jgi:hypothetical protein